MNKSLITLILSVFFCLNIENVIADDAKNWHEIRNAAKLLINSGNNQDIITGILKLKKLSSLGDDVSSHTLGVIYMRSKLQKIPKNPKIAEKYFLKAANNCYAESINTLDKLFYSRRGSDFFAPNKAILLNKKCQIKASVKPIIEPHKPSNSEEGIIANDELINSQVASAWKKAVPSEEKFKTFNKSGSGFAANANGLFITNDHVIDGCKNFSIYYNGMIGTARLLRKNSELDIAVLKVDAPTPYFAIFDSSKYRLGEGLVAIGYPAGNIFGIEPSLSEGRLTNTSDETTKIRKEGFLLVSVPMASGNSGGPVLNQKGLLRGIVSYGFDSDKLMDEIERTDGSAPILGTVTLNFMVSGLRVINWLGENDFYIKTKNDVTQNLDVVDTTEIGIQILAHVLCG